MQLGCLRSALHLIRFYELREQLAQAADKAGIRGQMLQILREEKANSLRALPYVEQDSRLGYPNGGNAITNGGVRAGIFTAASIRKKLAQIDRELREP